MSSFETPCPLSTRRVAMVLLASVIGATIIGCSSRDQSVQIRFELEAAPQVARVQFYVHTIELLAADGKRHPLKMEQQSPWQSERLALIELGGDQTSAARNIVIGRADAQRYTGIRFAVGVPFDLNHANPLTASAPLNRPDMFWTWQSGYKFLRIDLSTNEHEAAFHLGSTGCSSASALRPPANACGQPNSIRVELHGFDPLQQAIRVSTADLAMVLAPERVACTGEYSIAACRSAYALTGLKLDDGTCVEGEASSGPDTGDGNRVCRAQRLFIPNAGVN